MSWLQEIIGTEKPIIAMCHMQPMPGDPGYDKGAGMQKVLDAARYDLEALQQGGVDTVMFSNEFSLPYLTRVRPETVAAMACVIGQLKCELTVPFGVNCLWDPIASLDLAAATGAKFLREIISGVYASDFGLWNTNAGETARHQREIGAENVKLLFNIVPEAAKYMADRDIVSVAKSTVFNCRPDALCVSGLTAGVATDSQVVKAVKDAVPDTVVLCNTGCRLSNIEQQLSIADGAVVATTFKVDGIFENPVDRDRVKAFMDVVKAFRTRG
ncbi:MAG: BtpA/SgcQ family protein [Candidatus Limiplasma sp.]|nr:BtpA/SgcQ family protein [Candidatus Limiplasma sp.]